jgi:hypothetical protein
MLAFDQGDLAAQRLERLGHLDADRAAADDDHAPGDLLGGRRVAVRPQALNLLKPFDGGDQGHRAAAQDHRPPGFELLVPDHDASFAGEPPTSANKRHPVGRHPGHQVRVVGRAAVLAGADDLVAPAQHGGDVEAAVHGLPRATNAPRLAERLVRPQERFRGKARPVGALAPDEPVLHTNTTSRPRSASRAAASSPAGPPPSTSTSKTRIPRSLRPSGAQTSRAADRTIGVADDRRSRERDWTQERGVLLRPEAYGVLVRTPGLESGR